MAASSACLAGAEVAAVGEGAEAVGEEGAAAARRGLAGPRRVFTWQGLQTVQALGRSQSISRKTSVCLRTGGFSEGVWSSSAGNITNSSFMLAFILLA